MNNLKKGKYRHYKGKEYEVIDIAKHSETHEELVIYRALYGDHQLWIRPKYMFCEKILKNGKECPRFEYIGNSTLRSRILSYFPVISKNYNPYSAV